MSKELGLERTIGKKYFNGKQKNHVLVCPARTVRESSWGNWDGITLAYNQDTKDDGTFRLPKANSVRKTSLQLVFVDSWYDRNTTLGRNLGRYRLPSNQSVAFPHQKRSVALYLDGHAALEFQQWLRLNDQYYYPINFLLSEQAPRLGSTEPLTSFAPFD